VEWSAEKRPVFHIQSKGCGVNQGRELLFSIQIDAQVQLGPLSPSMSETHKCQGDLGVGILGNRRNQSLMYNHFKDAG